MEEENFWLFGPTDEPVASFDTSRLFGAFGGVTGEETGGPAFMLEEGQIEGSGLLKRIPGGLVAMIRYMTVMAMSSPMIEEGPVGD